MIKKIQLEQLFRKSLSEFHDAPKRPIILVLDNIRSAHNVGSLFRSADAFLTEEIHLCGFTASPDQHNGILKTALGATKSVKWRQYSHLSESLDELKRKKYHILCLEQTNASLDLSVYRLPESVSRVGIVCGNEIEGVQQEALDVADNCIEIKQSGTKHSLNVAVAGGIILWSISQQILPPSPGS